MKRLLLEVFSFRLLVALMVLGLLAVEANACPKSGNRLFKGHIRTAVHNVVDAPFKVAESKPLQTTFGFVAPTSGCQNGQCKIKK